jgi:hypothetical protein
MAFAGGTQYFVVHINYGSSTNLGKLSQNEKLMEGISSALNIPFAETK